MGFFGTVLKQAPADVYVNVFLEFVVGFKKCL